MRWEQKDSAIVAWTHDCCILPFEFLFNPLRDITTMNSLSIVYIAVFILSVNFRFYFLRTFCVSGFFLVNETLEFGTVKYSLP